MPPVSPDMPSCHLPSPLTPLSPSWKGADAVTLMVKRDDLIHPVISGNKWRKLWPAFADHTTPPHHVISFGGGFSNHLHALGYLCHLKGIGFTAIIRGNYRGQETPMLQDLIAWGASLRYVTKQLYQQREDTDFLNTLRTEFPHCLIIPEGGSQQAALRGTRGIVTEITAPFDVMVVPVASGGTLAGIISALQPDQTALGIGVLKGEDYLNSLVTRLLPQMHSAGWHIESRFHHGGYAKSTPALNTFCHAFSNETGIPVEPVYSGKMFFALKALIEEEYFAPGTRIVAVHTGGLQGAR
ncbi:1-aminocyclopropane-1-carboxylate deaminase/D-cysteine desulfhydrase [Alteromonas sp. CYL-A6]|uniref:1-aminocyclopropane-1-carboxylate deaminase/D-cysteine desulfhydrase n=1 Tax=Alteromonas nitratireducens TaxID=3390813 RepID=UPI0034A7B984